VPEGGTPSTSSICAAQAACQRFGLRVSSFGPGAVDPAGQFTTSLGELFGYERESKPYER